MMVFNISLTCLRRFQVIGFENIIQNEKKNVMLPKYFLGG